jgi:hypothetical protein
MRNAGPDSLSMPYPSDAHFEGVVWRLLWASLNAVSYNICHSYTLYRLPKELCIVEGNHYEMLGSGLDSWHEKHVALAFPIRL